MEPYKSRRELTEPLYVEEQIRDDRRQLGASGISVKFNAFDEPINLIISLCAVTAGEKLPGA